MKVTLDPNPFQPSEPRRIAELKRAIEDAKAQIELYQGNAIRLKNAKKYLANAEKALQDYMDVCRMNSQNHT